MLALVLLALIWGASFLFIKVALRGLAPTQIVAARLAFGAAALFVATRFGVAEYPTTLHQWRVVALLALMQNVIPFALFAWGEQRISSSLASVLNATTPLFTAVLAAGAGVAGEQLDRRRLAALAAGSAGVVVIMQPWQSGSGQVLGDLACLAAAACYGVGFVYTARYITGRMPSTAAAVGQVTTGAVMATVVAVVVTLATHATPHVDLKIAASVGTLGVFGTGLAYLLMYYLLYTTGPTATSAVTFVMPLIGVVLGVLVLGETIGWNVAAGGALVLVSLLAVRRRGVIEVDPVEAGAA